MYTEHPFSDDDERFVYHEHDFISVEEYEENFLDELTHRFMDFWPKGLLRVRDTEFLMTDDFMLKLTEKFSEDFRLPRRSS